MALTLAETLIVMGIIGVVAALTLPNLNNSTGEKEKVAKVKKLYSNIEDAFGRAQAVYGPYSEWSITSDENGCKKAGERITEFMKISKDCGYQPGSGSCLKGSIKKLDGTTAFNGPPFLGHTYLLADGAEIDFDCGSNDCYITFDIDGPNKGPFTAGIDYFSFLATDTGVVPNPNDVTSCKGSNGLNCTAWVVQFDNMDYTKADSSGKCKNNTSIVLDGVSNTTCK
ncbi:type II secretion system protein [bacterium]|nr:type II secretion system protein [bacterium]